ncbi:hypothetical protein PSH03_005390 [Micromonospora sp. PSH03]|uniref:hypothetical protein n=1 Tax=Micromonospora salmantinae TaxID=2911211 RepID=UPI001EE98A6F|nr:hypothetical protein [Micromonospora salmantinae]MCG5459607.1 hypothetical protein [Micromonospora salmantinae]
MDEAKGILSLEVVEGQRDYLVLLTNGNIGLIETRLRQVAAKNARTERIRKMSETGQTHYDPEYVRLFLPFFFATEDWPNGPADELSDRWTTGDAIDTALDIKAAWGNLREWQQRIIYGRHMLCPPSDQGQTDWLSIAEYVGASSPESAQSMYRKATRELSTEMNAAKTVRGTNHQGVGSRRIISNTRANAVISNNA